MDKSNIYTIIISFLYSNMVNNQTQSRRLIRASLVSDPEFVRVLNEILKHDLRISVRELSEKSGIAQSLALQDTSWQTFPEPDDHAGHCACTASFLSPR